MTVCDIGAAQSWRPIQQPDVMETYRGILESPLLPGGADRDMSMSLRWSNLTPQQQVLKKMRLKGLDPRIQMQIKKQGMSLTAPSSDIDDFSFSLSGYRFCDFQVKAVRLPGQRTAILGSFPKIDYAQDLESTDWPSLDRTMQAVGNRAAEAGLTEDLELESKEACLKIIGRSVRPVWNLTVKSGQLLYRSYADEYEAYSFLPEHFDIDGKATIYPNNTNDTATKEYTLTNLEGNGKLSNDHFYTVMDSRSQSSLANSPTHDFTFSPGTSEFAETSIFTNVNRAMEWLEAHGFESFGDKKMALVVHAVVQGDVNNALYQPTTNGPIIFVGDGDGTILQNLATDADVVSHELGHHVVYQSITSIEGDSLVLHEGLADYLTYARTGNTCLGESICPAGSNVCAVKDACLRTADNDYKFGSADLPPEAHLKSQLISGMLWDLRAKDNMPAADVDSLLLSAIEMFLAKTSYQNFLLALLHTDLKYFEGKYCTTLVNRAKTRGFGALLTDVTCGSALPAIANNTSSEAGTTITKTPTTRSKSGGGSTFCGTLTSARSGNPWLLWLLMASPLLVMVIRRKPYLDHP